MASTQESQGEQVANQADQAYTVLMDHIRTILSDEVPSLAGTDMTLARAAIEQVRQADHDLVAALSEAERHE